MRLFLSFPLLLVLCSTALGQSSPSQNLGPDYVRDIKPLLERNCIKCHGASQQLGGFRLDSLAAAMRGGASGARGLLPHDAAGSRLIQRISDEDDNLRMPPKSSGLPRLTQADIVRFRDWINAGPTWKDPSGTPPLPASTHWSLRPLPKIHVQLGKESPVDTFVNAKLREKRLKMSSRADKVTLLRRLYYDLIGLPPSPEDAARFVSDTHPDAYERVVDKLLASPRYGERWARHWLDTIHFADSHGFEHDIGRDNAWPFRDYVINAFNDDISWTNFIKQQLAADVFWPNQPALTPALGYLGAGTFDLSAYTTAPRNFENGDRDDLVNQTMSAFVSTTANCARCHNHKFDPIPQEDYYALQAVFSGVVKGDVTYDSTTEAHAERMKWTKLLADVGAKNPTLLEVDQNRAYIEKWISEHKSSTSWTPLIVQRVASKSGSTLTVDQSGIIYATRIRPETDTYSTFGTSPLSQITAIRLDVLSDKSLPMGGPGRQDNGNLHLSEIEIGKVDTQGVKHPFKISRATADFNQAGWGIERAIDGDQKTAWGIYPEVGKSHYAWFVLSEPMRLSSGDRLVVDLHQNHGGGHLIGQYRLSATSNDPKAILPLPADIAAAVSLSDAFRTADQKRLLGFFALKDYATQKLQGLPQSQTVFAAASSANVLTEGVRSIPEPRTIHLLERGEIDKPKQIVGPGALSAVKLLTSRFDLKTPKVEAERRGYLAEWIADKYNPLTWRSIVNRVWQYHFGRGICDTPSDFGKMGGIPSHPELLDYLAVWFRDDAGGSLKKLHRLIVTSNTYCQSSRIVAISAKLDGDNRLLWRQNSQRLDADGYRDFTLAVSGKLDLTMGGPGIKHFTSSPGPQLTPALNYYAYDWSAAGSGRRSIYSFVWRGIADPFMEALDFPDLGLLAPTRSFSVSALQALAMYNNNFILAASDAMAVRFSSMMGVEGQVDTVVQNIWLRKPTMSEKSRMVKFVQEHDLRALCRVLLNSNEFLFVK